jgi:hypothetical protein
VQTARAVAAPDSRITLLKGGDLSVLWRRW